MRILTCLALLAIATTATAAGDNSGDAQAGADKVATCQACHGKRGQQPAAPIYPRLAGQTSAYLESALKAYREGLRKGGNAASMTPQAATLSDEDIADIAAYYSEQDAMAE